MTRLHLRRAVAHLFLASAIVLAGAHSALAAVGQIEATYGVSQNGIANYSIPINLTDGINGLTPRLSIEYGGPTTRSILGVGFALSGISYITPCRKTIAQDVTAAPVTLTAADRYCLDGARLRQLVSTDTYGASNTQYRTEIDQLIRVTSRASTANVPGWFKAEMPDGLKYEYGNSTTSKLMSSALAGATPQFWAVSKISDANGNSIVFTYDKDDALGRFRPSVISYTEHGGVAHYKISFVYQTAVQPTPIFQFTPSASGGAVRKEDKLLERIELKHDDVVYRTIKFVYQNGAGQNQRLWTIEECAAGPPEDCLPTTQFTWQSATPGHAAFASSGNAVASGITTLDINGDGIDDLAWASSGTWRYMLGSPVGYGSIVNTGVTATNPTKAMPLEWNRDGYWDLLVDWSDGKWRVLRGGASGFNTTVVQAGTGGIPSNTANTSWATADVNADGRDDLISVPLNAALSINVRFNGSSGFGSNSVLLTDPFMHTKASNPFIPMNGASSSIRRPDFNGDGRTDLLIYGCVWETEPPGFCIADKWFRIMSQGSSFVNEGVIPNAAFNILVRYGDLNADGLTDIVYPATTGFWNVGFGQGDGSFSIVQGPSSAPHATYQTLIGDYDGDGYDDFYVTRNTPWQWEIFRSTGNGLATNPIATTISGTGLAWMIVKQDGDVLPDLGRYDPATLIWSVANHQGDPGELLVSAQDGLANLVTFNYLPMTDANVYEKGSGAALPSVDYEDSTDLVRAIQISPAGGTAYTLTYKYYEARFHTEGRAFLGMATREITDSRDGFFTIEKYHQDFPYIGALDTFTLKRSSAPTAKIVQSVTNYYFHHVLASFAGGERFLPYRSGVDTKLYEVGGIDDGNLITEIIEDADVDTFGNTTLAKVWTDDEDGGSPTFGSRWKTEVTTAYLEDQTNWCISLPTNRSEVRILPDLSSKTRTTAWGTSGLECRITQETLEPTGPNTESLVSDIGYDTCGNVSSVSSYPNGQAGLARPTTIDYGSRCQRPEVITNPIGESTTLAYNWPLGIPITQTDANSLVTTVDYDGFGRLSRLVQPNGNPIGTAVRFALTACKSSNNWCGKNSGARLKITRTERSTTDAILRTDEQFLDGSGRVRWSHRDSLESGPAIAESLYDSFGRLVQQTQPYFSGGIVYYTTYARDPIGRVSQVTAPADEANITGRITLLKYEGRETKITDPLGTETIYRSTPIGQLASVTQPSPGGITSYVYEPFGEVASISDALGNASTWTYNTRGYLTNSTDVDTGAILYEPNAFGETERIRYPKTNAPAWTMQFTFDKLSRPLTRVESEGTTTFTWGRLAHNTASAKYIGRLKKVVSPNGYVEDYLFDNYARISRLRTTIDGTNYDFNVTYTPTTGNPETFTYPTSTSGFRLVLVNTYQKNLLKSVGIQGSITPWTATSTDAFGHVQDELFGNGVRTFTDFDQATGQIAAREAGIGGGTALINSKLTWDLRGNLKKREDLHLSPTVAEEFFYDPIGRFDYSTRNGTINQDVTLDAGGNILWKKDVCPSAANCFAYHATKKRAVVTAGSNSYGYDANGNMSSRNGSTISYTSYNLPNSIPSGSNSSSLYYGAFRNRYKQIAVNSGSTETTIYVGGLFEKVTRGSLVEYRHYIQGGNGTKSIYTRRTGGTPSVETIYTHRDHLGSPEVITNDVGAEIVRPSFGAFGERRDGTDWNGPPSAGDLTKISNTSRGGFTGHDHLDAVGLVHMGGRVYDPVIAKFLTPDPIIGVGLTENVNSYSYALNNPLSVVDPTGLDVVTSQWIDGPNQPPAGRPDVWVGSLFDYLDAHGHLGSEQRNCHCMSAAAAAVDGYGPSYAAKDRWDGRSSTAQEIQHGAGGDILTPHEKMILANNSYADKKVNLPNDVTPHDMTDKGIDAAMLNDESTGFAAAIFKHGDMTYVSFRGTDSRVDWKSNGEQASGLIGDQYRQAVALAKKVYEATGGQVVFVGHSLGGGLASIAALATGAQAFTYNAAGLHPNTIAEYSAAGANPDKQVTAFFIIGDPLSAAQDLSLVFPSAVGRRVAVFPLDADPTTWHSRETLLKSIWP